MTLKMAILPRAFTNIADSSRQYCQSMSAILPFTKSAIFYFPQISQIT